MTLFFFFKGSSPVITRDVLIDIDVTTIPDNYRCRPSAVKNDGKPNQSAVNSVEELHTYLVSFYRTTETSYCN